MTVAWGKRGAPPLRGCPPLMAKRGPTGSTRKLMAVIMFHSLWHLSFLCVCFCTSLLYFKTYNTQCGICRDFVLRCFTSKRTSAFFASNMFRSLGSACPRSPSSAAGTYPPPALAPWSCSPAGARTSQNQSNPTPFLEGNKTQNPISSPNPIGIKISKN